MVRRRSKACLRGAGRRIVLVFLAAMLLVGAGSSHTAAHGTPDLTEDQATALVLGQSDVAEWLARYPEGKWVTTARFREVDGRWAVSVFAPGAGQIVAATVQDRSRSVLDVRVGPQVAWPLARGDGIGGIINRPQLWLAFCLFFMLGVADLKRPLSLRNLDLLALLSFSVSLVYLNDGRVFAADVAAAASFAYLIARAVWVGVTNRASTVTYTAPIWVLVAGLVFLVGVRTGLNTEHSTVLDVGYAGVIGADRLVHGDTPYGNFPRRDTGQPCGPPNAEGVIGEWVQADGRCETANELGDTYGPVNYHAYVPGLWLFGWSGTWDYLPAAHFTTVLFDLLAMAGLAAVGFRYGRTRLAVLLAFAWAANPFTQYTSSSNANDSIMAAFLIWGFWALTSPTGRGSLVALASWTKLAALILVPLWATYPHGTSRRGPLRYCLAFLAATLVSFWVLFLDTNPAQAFGAFLERTFLIQFERTSPFSLWDWGRYQAAGLPDLKWLQRLLQVVLATAAVVLAFLPRDKSPLQVAAFSAALLMAFQLLLTHWSALYIVWFLPFLLLMILAGDVLRAAPDRETAPLADLEPESVP